MIVGININTNGERYIAALQFDFDYNNDNKNGIAQSWKMCYDEVYIVPFDNCHEDFINEIVLKGCRI